jgi:hypothetical protein
MMDRQYPGAVSDRFVGAVALLAATLAAPVDGFFHGPGNLGPEIRVVGSIYGHEYVYHSSSLYLKSTSGPIAEIGVWQFANPSQQSGQKYKL